MKNDVGTLESSVVSTQPTVRYGIIADINRHSIVVFKFYDHTELLNLILSDLNQNLILYRTQYTLPGDDELEIIHEKIFELK